MIKKTLLWLPVMGLLTWGVGHPTKALAEVQLNFDFPVNTLVVNACTGDLVSVEGNVHILQILNISESGNTIFQLKQNGTYKGTGLFGGGKYTGSSSDSLTIHIGTGGCPLLQDASTRFRLNTKGAKNNLFVEGMIHLSTNNACELTNFQLEIVSATCK